MNKYYMPNSNVKLEFFEDRFEITSLGTLLKGLTIEDVLTGTSKLRNPSIAKIFEMLEYIEAYGTGFKRIFDLYKKFNMKPEIVVLPNFFRVVMPNIKYNKNEDVGLNVGLNELQNKIIAIIKNNCLVTQREIALELGVNIRTVERSVKELKEKGVLIKEGSKKKGKWLVIEKC